MERRGYPGANVHAAAHARFVREYADCGLYEQTGPSFAIAVKTATWVQRLASRDIGSRDLRTPAA